MKAQDKIRIVSKEEKENVTPVTLVTPVEHISAIPNTTKAGQKTKNDIKIQTKTRLKITIIL